MRHSLIKFLFTCGTLIVLNGVHAIAQQTENVTVQDPRPVAEAVMLLEQRYGWVVTYEDPEYTNDSDIQDVTALVQRNVNVGTSPRRVLIPAGGVLQFRYPLINSKPQEQPLPLLRRMLSEYATGSKPSFRVEQNNGQFHVIPLQVRNKAGQLASVQSPLDFRITITDQKRDGLEMLGAICEQLSRVSGHNVWVATVPLNALAAHHYETGVTDRLARDVLADVLGAVSPRLSWRLLNGPQDQSYALNVHFVHLPKEPESAKESAVPASPVNSAPPKFRLPPHTKHSAPPIP